MLFIKKTKMSEAIHSFFDLLAHGLDFLSPSYLTISRQGQKKKIQKTLDLAKKIERLKSFDGKAHLEIRSSTQVESIEKELLEEQGIEQKEEELNKLIAQIEPEKIRHELQTDLSNEDFHSLCTLLEELATENIIHSEAVLSKEEMALKELLQKEGKVDLAKARNLCRRITRENFPHQEVEFFFTKLERLESRGIAFLPLSAEDEILYLKQVRYLKDLGIEPFLKEKIEPTYQDLEEVLCISHEMAPILPGSQDPFARIYTDWKSSNKLIVNYARESMKKEMIKMIDGIKKIEELSQAGEEHISL